MRKLSSFSFVGGMFCCLVASAFADEGGSAWFTSQKRFLDCSPKVLRPGQTLVLTLGPGHGKELGIGHGDDWYSVIYYGRRMQGDIEPPMSSAAFAVAKRLEIPASAKAHLASHGVAPIFRKPGRYTVYVSDNLESEEPGYKCEFTFKK